MATPRAAPKRSGSSRGKWFFTGVLPIHETIPLQISDPFTALDEVGHTVSTRGSNAQMPARISERSVRYLRAGCVMLLTESLNIRLYARTTLKEASRCRNTPVFASDCG